MMNRRHFLKTAALTASSVALCPVRSSFGQETAPVDAWRTVEVTTSVALKGVSGPSRLWVPLPLAEPTPFQHSLSNDVQGEGGRWQIIREPGRNLALVQAHFPAGVLPQLTVKSRVALRNWDVDLQESQQNSRRPMDLHQYLQPTRLVPTSGVVRSQAETITRGIATDEEKARAIYEWIATNTYRKASVRGCGTGDIRTLLETGDLGGKCADLNALFVGLLRASGVPAREVYGLRVAPSQLGYKSLGPSTATVTKAQHCRAEFWLDSAGWVPADPADVRKVMLEEPPGNLPVTDEKVSAARKRLFGSWEMNWLAWNYAQDVDLPGSERGPVPFFMYPQAETAAGRLDSLDPESFHYEITAREIHKDEKGREQG